MHGVCVCRENVCGNESGNVEVNGDFLVVPCFRLNWMHMTGSATPEK